MKELLYITQCAFSNPEGMGVRNKILGQCKAFETLGYNVTLMYVMDHDMVFETKTSTVKYPLSWFALRFHEYSSVLADYLTEHKCRYDLIYARKWLESPFTLPTYKTCKTATKHLVMEVPTFPYDSEMKGHIKNSRGMKKVMFFVAFAMDTTFRKHLKKHVDTAVIIGSKIDSFYGIPAISIVNGVNIDGIPLRKSNVESNPINIIGVAAVSHWHGYDRVIKGLYEYYAGGGQENVLFHIVGEGDILQELKQLTAQLGMEKHVLFQGFKKGDVLNQMFDASSVAVSSLGLHRNEVVHASVLKSREYCARGIPFIYAYDDPAFSKNDIFALQIPANDSPVDIQSVLDLHSQCKNSPEIQNRMAEKAKNELSWTSQMSKVLESLKS